MSVRTDLTVDYSLSPRLVTVQAPSTSITIQDLVDTLRDFEDNLHTGMGFPHLINAAGKESLGGGLFVGITAELQNAQLAFEGRTTATSGGTVTSGSATVITDTSATFISDGVQVGAVVDNYTDGSDASVLSVDSETQLTTTPLTGGTDNMYDASDSYAVHNMILCTVSEGNLVAVDGNGASIEPMFTTPFVYIDRKASTSAALVEGGAESIYLTAGPLSLPL